MGHWDDTWLLPRGIHCIGMRWRGPVESSAHRILHCISVTSNPLGLYKLKGIWRGWDNRHFENHEIFVM